MFVKADWIAAIAAFICMHIHIYLNAFDQIVEEEEREHSATF